MKILILSDDHPDLELGGAGRIAHQSAQWLAARGHEVWFVAASADMSHIGTQEVDGLHSRIVYIPKVRVPFLRTLYSWPGVREARRIAREVKPDVIHAHGVHRMWSFAVLRAVRPLTRRLVWTAHDVMSVSATKAHQDKKPQGFSNRIRVWWTRKMVQNTDKVLAVSNALGRYLTGAGLHSNILTLHNAIDVMTWDEIRCEQRSLFPKHSVLLSGRMSGTKGVYVAIDAMRQVKIRLPDATLILAGGPKSAIQKAVAYAADSSLIQIVGQQNHENMKCLMQSCALVMTPSTYLDPFPTVNLEAMAVGIPVVGTKFGGTPELVVDGETGFIVDPSDAQAFADALTKILTDENLRARMGAAGRNRVLEKFNAQSYTDALLNIYTL